jgi:hypothetical protein
VADPRVVELMTPKRVDLNQVSLVQYARRMGAQVQHLSDVGHGCPDLLVARAGQWYLVEVKYGRNQLTPDEARWHAAFNAPVHIWRTVADVVRTLEGVGKDGTQ